MSSVAELERYYQERASEYLESVSYTNPEYRVLVAPLCARYQIAFEGCDVLELACGPGFWTEVVAVTARSIVATDLHANLVGMVRKRLCALPNVRCQVADAYTLEGVSGGFNAAFGQFWLSHIPRKKLASFFQTLQSKLQPGALVMFTDDLFSNGRGRVDAAGDLLEHRSLQNGAQFEIIKNCPTLPEFEAALTGLAEDIEYKKFRYEGYWTLKYRVRA